MHEIRDVPEPLNVEEKYLHGILIRLDAIMHMMSLFVETYADKHAIAVVEEKVVSKPSASRKKKKKEDK